MTKEVTLPSGKILAIQMADFKDGWELSQEVANLLKDKKLDLSFLNGKGKEDIELSAFIEGLLPLICEIISSPKILNGNSGPFKECMKRCTIDGLTLTMKYFEDPMNEENRADWLPAAKEILIYNIVPFVKGLGLGL